MSVDVDDRGKALPKQRWSSTAENANRVRSLIQSRFPWVNQFLSPFRLPFESHSRDGQSWEIRNDRHGQFNLHPAATRLKLSFRTNSFRWFAASLEAPVGGPSRDTATSSAIPQPLSRTEAQLIRPRIPSSTSNSLAPEPECVCPAAHGDEIDVIAITGRNGRATSFNDHSENARSDARLPESAKCLSRSWQLQLDDRKPASIPAFFNDAPYIRTRSRPAWLVNRRPVDRLRREVALRR